MSHVLKPLSHTGATMHQLDTLDLINVDVKRLKGAHRISI